MGIDAALPAHFNPDKVRASKSTADLDAVFVVVRNAMFGQRFRLTAATIAVMEGPEKRTAVQLPTGAQILVLDHIQPDAQVHSTHQVNVEWDGKVVSMFLVDIHEKGERIPPQSTGKSAWRP